MDTPAPPPMTMPSSKEMYGFGYLAITLFMVYSCMKKLHRNIRMCLTDPVQDAFLWQLLEPRQALGSTCLVAVRHVANGIRRSHAMQHHLERPGMPPVFVTEADKTGVAVYPHRAASNEGDIHSLFESFCLEFNIHSLMCLQEGRIGQAGHCRAEQSRAGQAGQSRAGKDSARQGRAGQHRTGQGGAGQGQAGPGRARRSPRSLFPLPCHYLLDSRLHVATSTKGLHPSQISQWQSTEAHSLTTQSLKNDTSKKSV